MLSQFSQIAFHCVHQGSNLSEISSHKNLKVGYIGVLFSFFIMSGCAHYIIDCVYLFLGSGFFLSQNVLSLNKNHSLFPNFTRILWVHLHVVVWSWYITTNNALRSTKYMRETTPFRFWLARILENWIVFVSLKEFKSVTVHCQRWHETLDIRVLVIFIVFINRMELIIILISELRIFLSEGVDDIMHGTDRITITDRSTDTPKSMLYLASNMSGTVS